MKWTQGLYESPRDLVWLKRPASVMHDMWKDALPIGDGVTGALIFGAVCEEKLILSRYDLWQAKSVAPELPDVSDAFLEMRRRIDCGDWFGAKDLLFDRLEENRQHGDTSPFPLCDLDLSYVAPNGSAFRHYRRGIDMAHGCAFVRWEDQNGAHLRRMFVSKKDGALYCDISCENAIQYVINCHASGNPSEPFRNVCKCASGETVTYSAERGGGTCGLALTVELRDADGTCRAIADDRLEVTGRHFTLKLKTFAKCDAAIGLAAAEKAILNAPQWDDAYRDHAELFAAAYGGVSVQLAAEDDPLWALSNRELLDLAYEEVTPAVLTEKLWRFARYLFLSGTAKGGNPFSLYGIWFADYDLCWCSNVCNENVEMIYWHVLSGGLADTLRELIHYYWRKIADCQNLAQKMFACRGIFLPAYTHPETVDGADRTEISPTVPVICNWISGAGWIALHFYQYYQYTHDAELLNTEILPFMIEAARFWADYVTFDRDGKVRIYPSVSPENTPGNLMPQPYSEDFGHVCPVTENATMDLAVVRSLLTNLLELLGDPAAGVTVDDGERACWEQILSALPSYQINEDGAISEWTTPKLTDFYPHRHFSHIFPLFPGNEVSPERDPELVAAFRRAIELRPHGAQSGWSFAHVAEIWEKLGDAEKAMENLDHMIKGCVLDNFMILHNDWRHMGASVVMDHARYPVQLDALMGYASAIQDMILQYREGHVYLLPAFPARFDHLLAKDLRLPQGRVTVEIADGKVIATLVLDRPCDLTVHLCGETHVLRADEIMQSGDGSARIAITSKLQ